ncbi:kinase-associated lipoprotein B [Bacillus sp. Marseille-P3661]|uniref:kinase-associated lipoprotein B n=1 Tax=Bacillus sp. Marseille-P3661 TaxID=1936234 RepID=UPI000C81D4A8|nr:kinase-associated lipoprotein B [Bacillus sp. Marseille-P3661]
MSNEFQLGQIVTGIYKTGKYIGEITAIKPQLYTIRVKAVLKHPQQGDLHAPKEADVLFFHERRALALNEQTNIPKTQVREYTEDVPDYTESLRIAISEQKQKLQSEKSDWANKSIEILEKLELDYFK